MQEVDYEAMHPMLAWLPVDIIKKTFEAMVQYARLRMSNRTNWSPRIQSIRILSPLIQVLPVHRSLSVLSLLINIYEMKNDKQRNHVRMLSNNQPHDLYEKVLSYNEFINHFGLYGLTMTGRVLRANSGALLQINEVYCRSDAKLRVSKVTQRASTVVCHTVVVANVECCGNGDAPTVPLLLLTIL